MTGVTFRPTTRTRLLMLAVVIAGAVGAFVLWRENANPRVAPTSAAATAPPEPTPARMRAMTQLAARSGRPMNLEYSSEHPVAAGTAVCGYAASHRGPSAPRSRQPIRVFTFVSLPDRVVVAGDPGLRELIAATCPSLPGAPAASGM